MEYISSLCTASFSSHLLQTCLDDIVVEIRM